MNGLIHAQCGGAVASRRSKLLSRLLLSDSRDLSQTLLSRTLYYLGHAGLVLALEKLPGLIPQAPHDAAEDQMDWILIGAMWSYVLQLLAFRNELRAGTATARALASGISQLVRQGITTPQQLWSDLGQGWGIQANASSEMLSLLTALEYSFPGTARYSIAKALTDQGHTQAISPPAEEVNRTQSPQGTVSRASIQTRHL
eukprot:3620476-Rhodomonas_salina.1